MKNLAFIISVCLSSCIGTDVLDDLMEEQILIESSITSLKIGESHQFQARYFNNIGEEVAIEPEWDSSNPAIITINNNGLATAVSTGQVIITTSYKDATDEIILEATTNETTTNPLQRKTELQSVSSYPLSGTVTLTPNDQGLLLEFADNFNTTSALPGLYVYLSNNTNTFSGALEIGPVTKFSGSQSYQITDTDDLYKYSYVLFFCKPFVVPVGNGKLNP